MLRLLSELANPNNNELLRRFYEDPPGVMGEFDLTEGEQAIVLSGDLEVIQAALDSAAIAADYRVGSATGVVLTYTPPPRPAAQSVVATF
jgi:hypothetical protein